MITAALCLIQKTMANTTILPGGHMQNLHKNLTPLLLMAKNLNPLLKMLITKFIQISLKILVEHKMPITKTTYLIMDTLGNSRLLQATLMSLDKTHSQD